MDWTRLRIVITRSLLVSPDSTILAEDSIPESISDFGTNSLS